MRQRIRHVWRPLWRRAVLTGRPMWQRILCALLVAGAVTVFFWKVWPVIRAPETCASGVERSGGECIGVNADGYDFGTAEITDVARAIADENARIRDEPHVTVAMVLPLQSDDAATRRQMRSDLQGAYLGQRQANRGKGEPPKIRLVLANPGRGYGQHEKVVTRLLEMADSSEDRLRAATGFNLSLHETRDAIARLTRHKVPVLASRISSDTITNVDSPDGTVKPLFPGLARILPTNHDAADALADFHGGRQDEKTVLVFDKRSGDSYNQSLAKAFSGIEEEGPPGPRAMSFESPGIDRKGGTGNQFTDLAHNICDSAAETVYFVGRSLHLRMFALKLAQTPCKDRHYTVVSGSDAASLRQAMSADDWEQLRGRGGMPKVTVRYAAPAHPDAWRRTLAEWDAKWKARHHRTPTDEDRPAYLTEPRDALRTLEERIEDVRRDGVRLGGRLDLEDSRTILVYDGLVTIGEALHQAQGGASAVPGRERVGQQWALLQSRHRVRGASGWICLTNGGNPYDKPVSVVELDPAPGRNTGGRLKFVGLGWPTGREQPENCVIPGDPR